MELVRSPYFQSIIILNTYFLSSFDQLQLTLLQLVLTSPCDGSVTGLMFSMLIMDCATPGNGLGII